MTDTPRTRAELLSIFADAQGPAQITPQDMRDLVVSVQALLAGDNDFSVNENGLAVSIPGNGVPTLVPFNSPNVKHDPGGNFEQVSSHASPDWWGATIPPKAYGRLHSGIWVMGVVVIWASNPGSNVQVSPDVMDNRIAQSPAIDSRFGDPNYDYYIPDQYGISSGALPAAGGLAYTQFTNFHFRVPNAGAPWVFGWWVAQESGSPINIIGLQVRAWQIAEVA